MGFNTIIIYLYHLSVLTEYLAAIMPGTQLQETEVISLHKMS